MRKIRKLLITGIVATTVLFSVTGCSIFSGSGNDHADSDTIEDVEEDDIQSGEKAKEPDKISGLTFDHEMPIEKSTFFKIDKYKDGYYVIKSTNGKEWQQLLVVPEGKNAPEGLPDEVVVVQQPVKTSKIDSITMAELLCEIDENLADSLSLVATQKEKIYTKKLTENMDKGTTQYAGSADKPDLELIKNNVPQVYLCKPALKKNKAYEELVKAGIKPFVTYLHNEADILGRIEWVKALGVIYGNTDAAEKFFNEQKALVNGIDKAKAGNKTYAMICLNKEKNKAYVRRTGDVIAKIGEVAGGVNKLADNTKGYWQSMSIDDFVANYKDADYLIYFDKHGDEVTSIKQLTDISDKLADFKSVKEGHVWRTRTDYLQMNKVGNMAKDLNSIFAGDGEAIKSVTEFIKVE